MSSTVNEPDSQRAAVYAAEDDVRDPWPLEPNDVTLRDYARICTDAFEAGHWGSMPDGSSEIKLVLGTETGAEENGVITIEPSELSVLTLAHELAHLATWHEVDEDHDGIFCAAYLDFARRLGSSWMAEELAYQFGKHNVTVQW